MSLKNDKNPMVSVLMSVYNAEKYLKESIESILAQTFTDIEFIIVDDASIDKTGEIISSYKDSRIVNIKNETNIGQTKSLNKAIKIARGKYIARMDGDDISLPNRFRVQVEFLNKNQSVKIVGSWYFIINEKGKITKKVFLPTNSKEIKALLITSSPLSYPYIAHPTVMIRRDIFEDIGYYDERYRIAQDYDLWVRVSRKFDIVNIPKILLKYRIHKKSLTNFHFQISEREAKEIVNSNITYYLPKINKVERNILINMLLFKRQNNAENGKEVFKIFKDFYLSVMSKELKAKNKIAINYFEKFKLFYLSKLFVTNRLLSLKLFLYHLFINPILIINRRFFISMYRAVKVKAISK